jgi:hypothetical protein
LDKIKFKFEYIKKEQLTNQSYPNEFESIEKELSANEINMNTIETFRESYLNDYKKFTVT